MSLYISSTFHRDSPETKEVFDPFLLKNVNLVTTMPIYIHIKFPHVYKRNVELVVQNLLDLLIDKTNVDRCLVRKKLNAVKLLTCLILK